MTCINDCAQKPNSNFFKMLEEVLLYKCIDLLYAWRKTVYYFEAHSFKILQTARQTEQAHKWK